MNCPVIEWVGSPWNTTPALPVTLNAACAK
jgi:hypothetical protein